MIVPQVNVYISRNRNGYCEARVRQMAADGIAEGRNLLTGRQITRISSARREAARALYGKAGLISWEIDPYIEKVLDS